MDESEKLINYDSIDRMIRLHDLIDKSKELEHKIEQQPSVDTLKAISKIVSDADGIIEEGTPKERASNTTEAVLDSMLLKVNHELVSKVFQHEATFNDNMYTKAIIETVFKGETKDWNAFAKLTCCIGRSVHMNPSMQGTINMKPKQRTPKQRQPRATKTLAAEQRPETANNLERKEEGSEAVKIVLQQIERIYKEGGRKPIPYYKLIIDPNNFMDTIHNAFQVCFLVRENVVAIEDGADGYPQVRIVTASERRSAGEPSQKICRLDMKLCEKMAKHYKITEAMLKTVNNDED